MPDRPHGQRETAMSFTLFSRFASTDRAKYSRWVRSAMVLGLAVTVSACAYDSPHYRSYGGHSSYHHGYYSPGPVYRHYSPRPDWRAQARHRQAQQRRHAEIRRHHFESRKRVERQRFREAHRHRDAVRGKPRVHEHRHRDAGPRHHQRHR